MVREVQSGHLDVNRADENIVDMRNIAQEITAPANPANQLMFSDMTSARSDRTESSTSIHSVPDDPNRTSVGIQVEVTENHELENKTVTVSTADIFSLPGEMLLEILSYLPHRELQVCRGVCQRWNQGILNWSGFLERTSYLLNRSHEVSYNTFMASQVLWRNLIFDLDRSPSTDEKAKSVWSLNSLPPHIKDKSRKHSVISIVIRNMSQKWSSIQKLLVSFPKLQKFRFVQSALVFERNDGWYQTLDRMNKFVDLQTRMTVLQIEISSAEDAEFLLKIFTREGCELSLTDLRLYVTSKRSLEWFQRLSSNLSVLIRSCQKTLKSLDIVINRQRVRHVIATLRRLLRKQFLLDLTTFKLECIAGSEYNPEYNLSSSEEATLFQFLRTQGNLKTLSIPSIRQTTELVNCVPTELINLRTYTPVMIPDLLERLTTLKSVELKSVTGSALTLGINDIIYPQLRSLDIWGFEGSAAIPQIVGAFPNLVKLSISAYTPAEGLYEIGDDELQTIIANLVNLESLALDFVRITDYGVSGIQLSDCNTLLRTKGVYMKRPLASLNVFPTGLPMSSLKHLRELKFDAKYTRVTDVGIYFGLGFENLQNLTFVAGKHLSDWGLVELGALNPNLETLYIFTQSPDVTESAVAILKDSLPRIIPRLFTVNINTEVDSDNDSVAEYLAQNEAQGQH